MKKSFKKVRGLSIAEVHAILQTAEESGNWQNYMMVYVCANVGLRSCELLAVRREHCEDLDDNVIHIFTAKQHRGSRKKKYSDYDSLVVPDKVARKIRGYVESLPEDQDYLFMSDQGRPMSRSTAWRVFHQMAEDAGVELERGISLHSLRHARAIYIYEKTKDIMEVKKFLRHRSLSSSMHYMASLEGEASQRKSAKTMVVFE